MAIAVHGENVMLKVNDTEVVLRELPEFSKPAKEKLETTCLNDKEKTYIAGIGDSISELTFKTLYDKALYTTLEAIQDGAKTGEDGNLQGVKYNEYVVTLSDGATFSFKGVHTLTYHGGSVNTVAEMSLVISIVEAPVFTAGE